MMEELHEALNEVLADFCVRHHQDVDEINVTIAACIARFEEYRRINLAEGC